MHILQQKHSKLKPEEADELISKLNISRSQLPKIKSSDAAIKELSVKIGDVVKIERKTSEGKISYFRVVIP